MRKGEAAIMCGGEFRDGVSERWRVAMECGMDGVSG